MHSLQLLELIDDNYTVKHCNRVAYYSELIARKLNLSEKEINIVKTAALLHDIGKIGVKKDILIKPKKLNENEWNLIKLHPVFGAFVVEKLEKNKEIIKLIIQHHERPDGKGYPFGLKEKEINFKSGIIKVADAFDAMTTKRPYQEKISDEKAIKEIIKDSEKGFNIEVVKALIKIKN